MAQQTKDTVKPWFETGDYPTQQQFWDFFDSILWKEEAQIADVAGLLVALQAKAEKAALDAFQMGERIAFEADGYYDIPQNYLLEKVIVLPGADALVRIGSGETLEDISPEQPVSAANGCVYTLDLYAKAGARRIHFTGLPANSFVIFLKRLIKTA